MKSPYVNELQPNQQATGVFLVHSKEVRQKKSGDLYLSLMLGDRTGELDAKMWDSIAEVMDTFDRDDFVRVKGVLNVFQNRPQLTIHKMQRVEESEIDAADFFPLSRRDLDEMFAELREVVRGIGNPHLRALLEAVFGDEGQQLSEGPSGGADLHPRLQRQFLAELTFHYEVFVFYVRG